MSFISAGNTTTTTLVVNGDTTGNLIFATGGANTTALTLTNTQSANFTGTVIATTANATTFNGTNANFSGLTTMGTGNATTVNSGSIGCSTFSSGGTTSLGGASTSVRTINFCASEVSWAQATTSLFLNLSDATGNNGSNYNLTLRGLASNGGAGASIAGFTVSGPFSASSKSFKIPHPLPQLKDTHHLVHMSVESPQADLIYRGTTTLVNGSSSINIDQASSMSEGTFVLLNKKVQCFTTNESDWDAVKGSVESNILTIVSQNPNANSTISWMVIGQRKDETFTASNVTDDNGDVIVEPLDTEKALGPIIPNPPTTEAGA
jgi:hypothetical protein